MKNGRDYWHLPIGFDGMTDIEKKALLWGPVSSFTGPLTAWLTKKGWHVDIACKSSLNLLSLSPLDLKSAARGLLESSYKSHNKAKAFADKFKFVDQNEALKKCNYDTIIFAGLPPNFDESRGPRAPWAADELESLLKAKAETTDLVVVSSVYASVQEDGVVPEELYLERRKALSNWESTCQQYESKVIDILERKGDEWSLVRLPLICGATDDGKSIKNNGLYTLFTAIKEFSEKEPGSDLNLNYSPDATLWYMPLDTAVYIFWRYLEDREKDKEGNSTRPTILNMVPTNPGLNREWLSHLAKAVGLKEVVPSLQQHIEVPNTVTTLLTDNVQVSTRNLFEAAGKYHIPPVKADTAYFRTVLAVHEEEKLEAEKAEIERQKETDLKLKAKVGINAEKLTKLYFEDFLPTVLNTDGFLDKAIVRGKDIGFKIKEASEDIWILKYSDGSSVAEKEKLVDQGKTPSICFKLSVATLLKLLEKKLSLHRALLFREVEVVGNPIKIVKVVRLLEKSFNENTLSKDQLEEVLV